MTIKIVEARIAMYMAAGVSRRDAYNKAITGCGLDQESLRQVRLNLDLETDPLHPEHRPSNWIKNGI